MATKLKPAPKSDNQSGNRNKPVTFSKFFQNFDHNLVRGFSEYRASAVALIVANLLPLFGVIFLKWDAFAIVALYWTENVVIGMINVLKMITCSPNPAEIDWSQWESKDSTPEMRATLEKLRSNVVGGALNHHTSKLFFVPFFTFHYGLFCFVHGVFVVTLLGPGGMHHGFDPGGPIGAMFSLFSERHLWWCVAALAASHLYSFFVNYLGHGENRRMLVPMLMGQPYARIVVLHLALLFGGWVAMALGSNIGVLFILIAGKTLLDLSFHLREHMRIDDDPPTNRRETVLEHLPPTQ